MVLLIISSTRYFVLKLICMLNDTICAISTAVKDGAISIVRMSGDDAFEIIRKISDIRKIEANHIVYGHIFDKNDPEADIPPVSE